MPRASSGGEEALQKLSPKKNKLASMVSGAASGILVSACVQPLDVLRTRMQADVAKGVYLNTLSTLQTVMTEGGVKALWKGTQATVLRLGFGAGLHFFFLESLKPLLEKTQPDGRKRMTMAGAAIAGGVARGLAAVVACPITLVKTQMEYTGPGAQHYTSTGHALSSIVQQRGVPGLFSGVGPTLLSQAPFSALYYVFYTQLQERLQKQNWPSFGVNFASGTVAAVAATILTQPADVVRTHMQLGLARPAGAVAAGMLARATSLQVLQRVLREQGMRGLMAGASPRIVKRTFQTALVWTIYEELMPALSQAAAWAAETREQQGAGSSRSSRLVSGGGSSSDSDGGCDGRCSSPLPAAKGGGG